MSALHRRRRGRAFSLTLPIVAESCLRVEVDRFDDAEGDAIFLEVFDESDAGGVRSACVELDRDEALEIARALRKAARKPWQS